jgi:putative FmdB family regulatory protein
MPIYEYRCSHCGHQQEFLQKLSDPPKTHCSQCGNDTLGKMLTSAGFQLKGSGWYATDFKGGAKPAAKAEGGESKPAAKPESGESKPAGDKKAEGSSSAAPACGTGACPACR